MKRKHFNSAGDEITTVQTTGKKADRRKRKSKMPVWFSPVAHWIHTDPHGEQWFPQGYTSF